jgi:ABC-type dipeptide/oligopeptide/nickel transport system permease component
LISFIIRRLLQLLFIVWGGITFLFILFFALPSNPADLLAGGGNRAPNPQVVKAVEKKYGLDDPIYVQYFRYMGHVVTFDFGKSYKTNESVNDIIKQRLPASLRLAFWAVMIETVFGISFGVLSARRRNSAIDAVTTTGAVLAGAVPVFVLGYLLKQVTGVYAFQHGWPEWARFPTYGIGPNEWYLLVIPSAQQFQYLLQPALILASVSTAIIARLTRTTMLEAMNADHVRTARAKGLREAQVLGKHTLRNALIPVVTFIGIDFGTLVGAAVLTETVFNWPGLGSKIAVAAANDDLPVVLGLTVVVILVYGVANLLVDISYGFLDPRIRVGAAK